jgi:hypothetical protein
MFIATPIWLRASQSLLWITITVALASCKEDGERQRKTELELERVLECTASAASACRCYCERWDSARVVESSAECASLLGIATVEGSTSTANGSSDDPANEETRCFSTIDTCTQWCVLVADAALASDGGGRCRAAMLEFRACVGSYPADEFRTWLVDEVWTNCAPKVDAFRAECGTAGFGADAIEDCNDGLDNDRDDATDCGDCDCSLDVDCVRIGSQCTPGSQTVALIPPPLVPPDAGTDATDGSDVRELDGDDETSATPEDAPDADETVTPDTDSGTVGGDSLEPDATTLDATNPDAASEVDAADGSDTSDASDASDPGDGREN